MDSQPLSPSQPSKAPLLGSVWFKLSLLGCGGIIAVLLAGLLVIGIILVTQRPVSSGSEKQVSREPSNEVAIRTAIERVFAGDHVVSTHLKGLVTAETKPAEAIAAYATGLRAIDTAECPPEFREAYSRHASAWEAFALQLANEPQSFGEGVLQGLFNAMGGEMDGGVNRMQRDRDARFQKLEETWGEVLAIAARYGAKPRTD